VTSQASHARSSPGDVSRARRDGRVAASQTIGCALATLRRLDHIWYDDDLCSRMTEARRTLSVTQSVLKEKLDATENMPVAERESR
jgi:hypothetical protein